MKHSPGPWKIGFGCGDQDEYFTVVDRDGEAVTDYSVSNHDVAMSHGQMVANARLIAAAPDLLAALERLTVHLSRYDLDGMFGHDEQFMCAVENATEAIAKAKKQ